LPSPLASFGVEIQWPGDSSSVNGGGGGGATMLERAPLPVVNQAVQPAAAVAEAEVLPTLGNVIESDDDDDDIGNHHLIPAAQRGEEETSLPLQQPPPPLAAVADQARSSMPALNGSGMPIERRWSSSSGVTDKPQRRRSLMFQPLLDVAAVGALIDTFADRPLLAPAMAPTATTASAAAPPPPHASDAAAATDGPKQRIIGGLRRATTVISANRHKLKLLRRRPSAEMLSAIESVQPDDDEFSEKNAVAPQMQQQQQPMANQEAAAAAAATPASPPTHRVRRAGTLNIAALRQQQQQQPSAATARLKRSPTHHGQPPPQPQPIAAASTDISATGSLGLGGGYAPIAVSLKSSRSRQFLLNTPLGEFEVLRTLGQGSYGKVKLMRSALTAEQFAVKIIKRYPPHKHRRGHAEFRKAKTLDRRVVREANLAAILGQLHPHIVPLHDFRVTDTHFYLFYAYVSGVTLAERVGSSGLSEREARAVFKPVVETIRFCHQYSVIHRDIKLENVLIDYADEAQDAWPLLGRGGGGGGAASSAAALSSAGATGA
ncbi:Serine/threonine-protein kinase, partial [Coemansia sp. RSA 2681]